MPVATLDPDQLDVYGWETSLWKKIKGYFGILVARKVRDHWCGATIPAMIFNNKTVIITGGSEGCGCCRGTHVRRCWCQPDACRSQQEKPRCDR